MRWQWVGVGARLAGVREDQKRRLWLLRGRRRALCGLGVVVLGCLWPSAGLRRRAWRRRWGLWGRLCGWLWVAFWGAWFVEKGFVRYDLGGWWQYGYVVFLDGLAGV